MAHSTTWNALKNLIAGRLREDWLTVRNQKDWYAMQLENLSEAAREQNPNAARWEADKAECDEAMEKLKAALDWFNQPG